MTSLVSSYHKGSLDNSSESVTQQKLNACILALQNMVDEWKPDETEQDYIDFTLEPTLYYYGFTKDVGAKPSQETPVLVNIGQSTIAIGKIDNKGIFITTKKAEEKEHINKYEYVSIQTEDWKGTQVPTPSSSHTDFPYYKKTETEDDAVLIEDGTKSLWNVTTYYNIHWVDESGWIPGPGGEPTIDRPHESEYNPPDWGSGWFYSHSPWYVWLHVVDSNVEDRYHNICDYNGTILQPYYPPTDPIYVLGYWAARKQTRAYYLYDFERTLDLSKYKLSFNIRLRKE